MPCDDRHRNAPLGCRGEPVLAAVRAATLRELAECGYAALTIDNVARRAGVHKTTVYRRWHDREQLLLDALSDHVATEVPVPDTGDVERDLRELARGLVRWIASPAGGGVLATMLSDAGRVPAIAEARRRFYRQRFEQAAPIVRRAIERRELPAGTDPAELLKALMAPIYLRLLVTGEPLDEEAADRAAEVALAAARAGALSNPPRT
ncbi:TetR/AcrR family transcriptional regulator [Conexibacter woesei]|uniref:Transcriptional regulator, TetR family n=1 Tax=Conexibacter woesei (strain DSM 14684 / CCUG 47730 / CIP 108061 / JCM 11494 / NBRC 100937 / ID131577) TaxID=469383 RepID=D3F641_CONWI|nr:TetR/AcrR family transcriptional regulator [Conexibacter woesei]ADB48714.1 transcriptional regulator, TetR family [Conexibacter woesei DSM 14684]